MNTGFSLIECMVYIAASSMLLVCALNVCITSNSMVTKTFCQARTQGALYMALETMTHDIAEAPCDHTRWLACTPSKLLWETQEGATGYYIHQEKILRVVQSRNPQGSLRKPSYSLMAAPVQGFFNTKITNTMVEECTIMVRALLGNKPTSVTRRVLIQHGRTVL